MWRHEITLWGAFLASALAAGGCNANANKGELMVSANGGRALDVQLGCTQGCPAQRIELEVEVDSRSEANGSGAYSFLQYRVDFGLAANMAQVPPLAGALDLSVAPGETAQLQVVVLQDAQFAGLNQQTLDSRADALATVSLAGYDPQGMAVVAETNLPLRLLPAGEESP